MKTDSSTHEVSVLPVVVVIDTSEKAEAMAGVMDPSLLSSLCTASHLYADHPYPMLSIITSGAEPKMIKCWYMPFQPKRTDLVFKGENHMHRSLYMAIEEIRWLCRHLEHYEIAYEKPRIYMLNASEADDDENGVIKALHLRMERGRCDFIEAVYGIGISADGMSFDTLAQGLAWIEKDLKLMKRNTF